MRFDPNRVIDRAARFEAARPEHSPAMRRAVEEARQALVGAGWNVEVIPAGPRWTGRRHALAGTLIVATVLAVGSLLIGLMKDQDVWIAGALSAVLWLGLTLVHVARWRWDRNRERRDPSVHLLATVLPATPRRRRLVILADSHTRDVGKGRRLG
ncbi:MAG: hypothetical protein U0794_06110 [Isosphaeraceae bacterium]